MTQQRRGEHPAQLTAAADAGIADNALIVIPVQELSFENWKKGDERGDDHDKESGPQQPVVPTRRLKQAWTAAAMAAGLAVAGVVLAFGSSRR